LLALGLAAVFIGLLIFSKLSSKAKQELYPKPIAQANLLGKDIQGLLVPQRPKYLKKYLEQIKRVMLKYQQQGYHVYTSEGLWRILGRLDGIQDGYDGTLLAYAKIAQGDTDQSNEKAVQRKAKEFMDKYAQDKAIVVASSLKHLHFTLRPTVKLVLLLARVFKNYVGVSKLYDDSRFLNSLLYHGKLDSSIIPKTQDRLTDGNIRPGTLTIKVSLITSSLFYLLAILGLVITAKLSLGLGFGILSYVFFSIIIVFTSFASLGAFIILAKLSHLQYIERLRAASIEKILSLLPARRILLVTDEPMMLKDVDFFFSYPSVTDKLLNAEDIALDSDSLQQAREARSYRSLSELPSGLRDKVGLSIPFAATHRSTARQFNQAFFVASGKEVLARQLAIANSYRIFGPDETHAKAGLKAFFESVNNPFELAFGIVRLGLLSRDNELIAGIIQTQGLPPADKSRQASFRALARVASYLYCWAANLNPEDAATNHYTPRLSPESITFAPRTGKTLKLKVFSYPQDKEILEGLLANGERLYCRQTLIDSFSASDNLISLFELDALKHKASGRDAEDILKKAQAAYNSFRTNPFMYVSREGLHLLPASLRISLAREIEGDYPVLTLSLSLFMMRLAFAEDLALGEEVNVVVDCFEADELKLFAQNHIEALGILDSSEHIIHWYNLVVNFRRPIYAGIKWIVSGSLRLVFSLLRWFFIYTNLLEALHILEAPYGHQIDLITHPENYKWVCAWNKHLRNMPILKKAFCIILVITLTAAILYLGWLPFWGIIPLILVSALVLVTLIAVDLWADGFLKVNWERVRGRVRFGNNFKPQMKRAVTKTVVNYKEFIKWAMAERIMVDRENPDDPANPYDRDKEWERLIRVLDGVFLELLFQEQETLSSSKPLPGRAPVEITAQPVLPEIAERFLDAVRERIKDAQAAGWLIFSQEGFARYIPEAPEALTEIPSLSLLQADSQRNVLGLSEDEINAYRAQREIIERQRRFVFKRRLGIFLSLPLLYIYGHSGIKIVSEHRYSKILLFIPNIILGLIKYLSTWLPLETTNWYRRMVYLRDIYRKQSLNTGSLPSVFWLKARQPYKGKISFNDKVTYIEVMQGLQGAAFLHSLDTKDAPGILVIGHPIFCKVLTESMRKTWLIRQALNAHQRQEPYVAKTVERELDETKGFIQPVATHIQGRLERVPVLGRMFRFRRDKQSVVLPGTYPADVLLAARIIEKNLKAKPESTARALREVASEAEFIDRLYYFDLLDESFLTGLAAAEGKMRLLMERVILIPQPSQEVRSAANRRYRIIPITPGSFNSKNTLRLAGDNRIALEQSLFMDNPQLRQDTNIIFPEEWQGLDLYATNITSESVRAYYTSVRESFRRSRRHLLTKVDPRLPWPAPLWFNLTAKPEGNFPLFVYAMANMAHRLEELAPADKEISVIVEEDFNRPQGQLLRFFLEHPQQINLLFKQQADYSPTLLSIQKEDITTILPECLEIKGAVFPPFELGERLGRSWYRKLLRLEGRALYQRAGRAVSAPVRLVKRLAGMRSAAALLIFALLITYLLISQESSTSLGEQFAGNRHLLPMMVVGGVLSSLNPKRLLQELSRLLAELEANPQPKRREEILRSLSAIDSRIAEVVEGRAIDPQTDTIIPYNRFASSADLLAHLRKIIKIQGNVIKIKNKNKFRRIIPDLIYTAVFSEDKTLKGLATWIIHEAKNDFGLWFTSTQGLYETRAAATEKRRSGQALTKDEERILKLCLPAVNIRADSSVSMATLFRQIIENKAGPFILEIARSEIGYTKQRPLEYSTVALAAAIYKGYQGPLMLQLDHLQAKDSSEKELIEMSKLAREAIAAGFGNIDLDMSTLVNYSKRTPDGKPDIKAQQELNAQRTAELTVFIRAIEPKGITITIGAEVGEIGGSEGDEQAKRAGVATEEEIKIFMQLYRQKLADLTAKIMREEKPLPGGLLSDDEYRNLRTTKLSKGQSLKQVAKMSAPIGTAHGKGARISADELKQAIAKLCAATEEVGVAVFVIHGFSLVPVELYPVVVDYGAGEAHLASRFHKIVNSTLPKELQDKAEGLLKAHLGERAGSISEEDLGVERKRFSGFVKQEIWNLPAH
ncbi:MAG: class II fructose-bisphosphate aldolase, partial [Candidatus Omnitrophica bacterium]|nr:class II fructose-bisphosphate aldolase [Candidatus Omnitrophota bacterium]